MIENKKIESMWDTAIGKCVPGYYFRNSNNSVLVVSDMHWILGQVSTMHIKSISQALHKSVQF